MLKIFKKIELNLKPAQRMNVSIITEIIKPFPLSENIDVIS